MDITYRRTFTCGYNIRTDIHILSKYTLGEDVEVWKWNGSKCCWINDADRTFLLSLLDVNQTLQGCGTFPVYLISIIWPRVHKAFHNLAPVFTKLFIIWPRVHKAFHNLAPCSQRFSESGAVFTKLFRICPRVHKAFQNQDQYKAYVKQSFTRDPFLKPTIIIKLLPVGF